MRNFYGLHKTHKFIIIESTINTQNSGIIEIFEPNHVKLRQIVGGPACLARKLSQLIDILLKPFLTHINSFIRDSLDFLIKYPRNVDEDTEIATFDVDSLYTNIIHKFGFEAPDYFFANYHEDLHSRFEKEFVLESANFTLKNNTLTFDSEFYLQGTSMDTIFTPTYANLRIGYYEIKVYSIICQSYALSSKYFKNNCLKILDNCEILLKVNLIKPDDLFSIFN